MESVYIVEKGRGKERGREKRKGGSEEERRRKVGGTSEEGM